MKHLLDREEFLNEGFRDSIKNGFNKLKAFFQLGVTKIKNMLVAFDNTGKILPVITPHAVLDHFSNVNGADVAASKGLSKEISMAGGNSIPETMTYSEDNEIYSYVPKFKTRKELVDWYKSKGYESDSGYQNFIKNISSANEGLEIKNKDELNEGVEDAFKERNKYTDNTNFEGLPQISYKKFEKLLRKRLVAYTKYKNGDEKSSLPPNLLVFGAPGIGKSTIPNKLKENWNNSEETKDKQIGIIVLDTQTIKPGDLMMPEIPNGDSVLDKIKSKNESEYQYLMNKRKGIFDKLSNIFQNKTRFMCPAYLPCYMKTNDAEVDEYLNNRANGGEYDENGNCIKEGHGGLLFFDELLRTDIDIIQEMMNFFSKTRTLNGWTLGDRWAIIACTNRPIDSSKVRKAWKEMSEDGALSDRFPQQVQLVPDPESWRDWAKNYLHADDLILEYIFDEETVTSEGEYPRWHSYFGNTAENKLTINLSPRKWEEVILELDTEMENNEYTSISQMDKEEIIDTLEGYLDDNFLDDFATWITDHATNINIQDIIESKGKVSLKKSALTDDILIIRDVWNQVVAESKNGNNIPDKSMKYIVLWLCQNFPDAGNSIGNDFVLKFDEICPKDDVLMLYKESFKIYNAAFLSKDTLEMLKNGDIDKEYMDYDELKEICKKYFPDKLKDGEIIPYNNWDLEDEDEDE